MKQKAIGIISLKPSHIYVLILFLMISFILWSILFMASGKQDTKID